MARPKAELVMTERRHRTAQAIALRERLIFMRAAGLESKSVAKVLSVSLQIVRKWRPRFIEQRVHDLYDEPRPGAPRQITDA